MPGSTSSTLQASTISSCGLILPTMGSQQAPPAPQFRKRTRDGENVDACSPKRAKSWYSDQNESDLEWDEELPFGDASIVTPPYSGQNSAEPSAANWDAGSEGEMEMETELAAALYVVQDLGQRVADDEPASTTQPPTPPESAGSSKAPSAPVSPPESSRRAGKKATVKSREGGKKDKRKACEEKRRQDEERDAATRVAEDRDNALFARAYFAQRAAMKDYKAAIKNLGPNDLKPEKPIEPIRVKRWTWDLNTVSLPALFPPLTRHRKRPAMSRGDKKRGQLFSNETSKERATNEQRELLEDSGARMDEEEKLRVQEEIRLRQQQKAAEILQRQLERQQLKEAKEAAAPK
ncbi:hypothetical protein K431DRAFT_310455 [Polychaeton citri CBS 116435]|uniref:Uncharacterized protein n=1 Tax=Polychaeton citri CBS 116435 TaxID=1314669 RepID=A0A9P4QBH3_9PEZI|nr:hypothetical protein K431DRAFT_310455 [Polychaeton citri CBS 116435]